MAVGRRSALIAGLLVFVLLAALLSRGKAPAIVDQTAGGTPSSADSNVSGMRVPAGSENAVRERSTRIEAATPSANPDIASTGGAVPPQTLAEQFNAMMNLAVASGGPDLVRAFDLHDGCAGIPAGDAGLERWIRENVARPDVDVDTMRRRVSECRGMPRLSFDTRRDILRPLAIDGDADAQFLLASLHPYGTRRHVEWLRAAVEGGQTEAMVLLAQDLLGRGPVRYGRAEAYRLLARAAEQGHPWASSELELLKQQLTSDELRLALSDEPIPGE